MSEVSQTRRSYTVNHSRVVAMLDIRATALRPVARMSSMATTRE